MKQYFFEGYVLLEDFFSPAEVDPVRERLDSFDAEKNRQLRESGRQFIQVSDGIMFTNGINFLDPVVQAFTAHPILAALSVQLLGPDVRLYWDQSVYKRPEMQKDFPWHQDATFSMYHHEIP